MPRPSSPPARKPSSSSSQGGRLGRRAALLGTGALASMGAFAVWQRANAASIKATLYKNPQCSCCESYATYLGRNGFDVTVIPSNDLELLNQQHGVPAALDGCHTTLMEGYVVVGHVPVEVVERLLKERPDITGIAIPGMPSGTPGMEGPKDGPITIYAFGKSGQSVFATV